MKFEFLLAVCSLELLSLVSAFTPLSSSSLRPPLSLRSASASSNLDELYTSAEEHALEVFSRIAGAPSQEDDARPTLDSTEALYELLLCLDVEVASIDEANVLFRYLDANGDNQLDFWSDFLPWYRQASEAATAVAESFQSLIVGRRTVEQFDETRISDDVLERAVQCAISAPNRNMSEPWRFIHVGPKTVEEFAKLNERVRKNMESDDGQSSVLDWTKVPGWCVVTAKISPDDPDKEREDFKSVSCAIQNFMLSMWAEGVGTKWTSGPVQTTKEFADLCGVDTKVEKVVGCIWYGYATGGGSYADPRRRKKTVKDVLTHLP